MPEIYLDHAASTPLRAESQAAWIAATETHHANPTGAHKAARDARRTLDDARDLIASQLGRPPAEVVFTSGGSEADNLAVRGVLAARGGTPVCSAGEHHAVLEPVEHAGGVTVALNAKGQVTPEGLAHTLDTVKSAGDDDVSVVSIIAVNNETGAINDLPALARVVRKHAPRALFHTDAVQALAWVDLATAVEDVDMLSITGHKVGAPVGTGVLFVRTGIELEAQILGGGQERGRRAGTPDVAGAAAFAAAVEATVERRASETERLGALRDRLVNGLVDRLGSVVVPTLVGKGHDSEVAAGIAHLCFREIEAEALLFLLDAQGLRASAASSCSSGAQEPSHVLAAMGVPRELAAGSLRLSLGHSSTAADVEAALEIIPNAVERLLSYGGG